MAGNEVVCLTLELTSGRGSNEEVGSVKKIELNDGGIRLIVTLPRLIDGEQANLTAALLFEQIDRLSDSAQVERVKLSGLHFTAEGVMGINGFLSVHSATIKHVSLKDMMAGEYNQEDAEAFSSLAEVFQTSNKLETLNLSDNTISASMWRNWSMHTSLRQLILDYVYMDDESLVELQSNFTFADTLEELYVVLTNKTIGPLGLQAANSIVKCCRKVSSLRWAIKDAPPDTVLPWDGLYELAQETNNCRARSNLIHLVMDGGTLTQHDIGERGLPGALKYFTNLKTMKLRAIGLKDDGARNLVSALSQAKPPLETIDLSRNCIQSNGAASIASLSGVEQIVKTLTVLALDRNNIEAGGIRTVLEAFGSNASNKMDVKLDGNPFHYGKVAFNLACRKGQAEAERNMLQEEVVRLRAELANRQNDSSVSVEDMQKLQDEKSTLLKAFAIASKASAVEEHFHLFNRVANLEASILLPAQEERTPSRSAIRDESSKIRRQARRSSIDSAVSAPLPLMMDNRNQASHRYESPSRSRKANLLASNNSNNSCNSTNNRKNSPHASTTLNPMSSPSRRSVKDLVSPIGHHNASNLLVRGVSERWGTSPGNKVKPPPPAATVSPYATTKSGSGINIGRYIDSSMDDHKNTTHSRGSMGSDQPHGPRDIEYASSNNGSYSGVSANNEYRH